MDPIRSFHGKLRSLASMLDCETARLQRALGGEDGDFEDYPMRILYDLHSEVQTLKGDVNVLLDQARLESQESTGFIKATKVLMKKNSADIMKIRELFQKYGYSTRVQENSVSDQDVTDSTPELATCKDFQKPDGKDDLYDTCAPSSSVSEKPPRSPQLSDFGLERYMISQVLPNPPQAAESCKEECTIETPSIKDSLVKVLKTPKCAIKMDDFECVTPKLEHFGVSEYTMCLNEDYTMTLKNMNIKSHTSEEATGTDPVTSDNSLATPDPVIQRLEKGDAEYTNSPVAPKFCTPGLKVPSAKNSAALASTNCPLLKSSSSSNDLEVKDCAPFIFNSECYENFAEPSSPTISYENLLRTPSPPEVTVIPEDILQILSKHNSNLATPVAVKAVPPGKGFGRYGGQSLRGAGNKENW